MSVWCPEGFRIEARKAGAGLCVLWAFKLAGCLDCGRRPESFDELKTMFDADHRDPAQKERLGGSVAYDFARYNARGALQELTKCDPVCHDCHNQRGQTRKRESNCELSLPLKEWAAQTTWGVDFLGGEQFSFMD